MSNKVRFMFLRNSKSQPVGCVAIKLDRAKGRAHYQVSVLNPHDKFNRAVGRQLALGRLHESPLTVVVGKEASMHDISKAVLMDVERSKKLKMLPTRAVKAASLWLDIYGTLLGSSTHLTDPFDSAVN